MSFKNLRLILFLIFWKSVSYTPKSCTFLNKKIVNNDNIEKYYYSLKLQLFSIFVFMILKCYFFNGCKVVFSAAITSVFSHVILQKSF